MRLPTYADVLEAQARLRPHIFHTPLLRSPALDEQLEGRLLFKPESLQITGSFKVRGAFNRLLLLTEREKRAGVVAWSAGNHGQAIAYAGRRLGIGTTIVMPSFAPAPKIAGTRRWGAEIVFYDDPSASREDIGRDIARRTGAIAVPPFDDADVIAGQGTVALEALQDAGALGLDLDRMFCGVGGGGLIAGCALAAEGLKSKMRLHSVEPDGFDDTARSLAAGERVKIGAREPSICDALMTPTPGVIPFQINRERLDAGLSVDDDAVRRAVQLALTELKLVLEPGGAAALAAALARPDLIRGATSVIVLSGGNIDPSTLASMLV